MSGFFDALRDDEDSEESVSVEAAESEEKHIPAFEDLSTARSNEETALLAIYENDFKSEDGAWGCKRLNVIVKPPGVDKSKIGNQFM